MLIGNANTIPNIVNLPGQGNELSEDYIVKVQPSLDTSNPTQVTIGIRNLGAPYTVDWGDGEVTSEGSPIPSHTYTEPGDNQYTVTVTPKKDPSLTGPQITQLDVGGGNTSTVRRTLVDIIQFGKNAVINAQSFMDGCQSLGLYTDGDITANDLPKVENANAGQFTFRNCINLNTAKFTGLFKTANQKTKITSLRACFLNCAAFNKSGYDAWDTSEVITFLQMFDGASNFNQDLSNWDTRKAVSLERMFEDAGAFDQSLAAWDIPSLNSAANFKRRVSLPVADYTAISEANASATLVSWAGKDPVPEDVDLLLEGSTLNTAGTAARNTLTDTKGWTIEF